MEEEKKNNADYVLAILGHLEQALDYEETDLKEVNYEKLEISETRWNNILEMLIEAKRIKQTETGDCLKSTTLLLFLQIEEVIKQ